jgi:outer membrane protein assembly factor BamD (BamD/ComL family)
MRIKQPPFIACIGLLAMVSLCACTPTDPPADQTVLNEGYAALERKEYDQAIARAEAFLRAQPAGNGSAEALYLKGRALEEKPATTEAESRANWQAARLAYIQALEQRPSSRVEAYIRTSLANVAYFQDDYSTALQQWSSAYEQLDRPEVQAWVLYRMGLCQQRMNRFEQADKTFAQVQQRYPNSLPAQRAREHQGARDFHVQLATFSTSTLADRAAAALRGKGTIPQVARNANGQYTVRVGPVRTYAEAKTLRSRFLGEYPDAFIVP